MKDLLQKIIDFIKSLISQLPADKSPVVVSPTAATPWQDWFAARLGWTEFNHDKELSLGWPLVGLPQYHTVIGTAHAWCGMSLATALHSCGYKFPNGAAGAVNWIGYGTKLDFKKDGIPKGAVVVIRHSTGAHHVTTAARAHKAGELVLQALGGNQDNSICSKSFNVSGNFKEHDEIRYVGWPVRA